MKNILTQKEEELREEFYERFKLGYFSLNTPTLIRKDFFDFLTKIRRQAIAEERGRILTKISEYRCHPDEIHCTCMDALKNWLENDTQE